MSEEAHICCDEADRYLWKDDGEWLIDYDNGTSGPTIHFCPFCGAKLDEERHDG